MKIRIVGISPGSLAAIAGACYFLVGLLVAAFGIVGALIGADVTLVAPFGIYSGLPSSGFSILILCLFMPFIYAILGFISGFVIAWIYNIAIGFTKGLLLETREESRTEM